MEKTRNIVSHFPLKHGGHSFPFPRSLLLHHVIGWGVFSGDNCEVRQNKCMHAHIHHVFSQWARVTLFSSRRKRKEKGSTNPTIASSRRLCQYPAMSHYPHYSPFSRLFTLSGVSLFLSSRPPTRSFPHPETKLYYEKTKKAKTKMIP